MREQNNTPCDPNIRASLNFVYSRKEGGMVSANTGFSCFVDDCPIRPLLQKKEYVVIPLETAGVDQALIQSLGRLHGIVELCRQVRSSSRPPKPAAVEAELARILPI